MASGILGTSTTSSLGASATGYFPWSSQWNGSTNAETDAQIKFRGTGVVLKNMRVLVASNAATATTLVTSRRNTAAGNLSVSIGAGVTGLISDTTNSDTLTDGDLICVKAVAGAGGAVRITGITAELNGGTATIFSTSDNSGTIQGSTAAIVAMGGICNQTGTENLRQVKAPCAGTLSNLQVNIKTASSGIVTGKTRKNGADGTQAVSISASTTGITEDTTHSDSIAANDLINFSLSSASAATGNLGVMSVKFTGTGTSQSPLISGPSGNTQNNPSYMSMVGQCAPNTTESQTQIAAPIAGTLSALTINVQTNSAGSATTIVSRVNGVTGNMSVTIPASTTGQFQDTTHSDTLAAGDKFNVMTSGTAATSVTVNTFSSLFTGPSAGGGGSGTFNLASTNDDVYYYSGGGTATGGDTVQGSYVGFSMWSGARFTNVTIPQGATITSATLICVMHSTANDSSLPSGSIWGKWYGDKVANAATWQTTDPSTITKTTAFTSCLSGTDETTVNHDVTAIVQELVNQGSWASGNAMRFAADPTGANGACAYYGYGVSTAKAPKLTVTYTTAGGVTVTRVFATIVG